MSPRPMHAFSLTHRQAQPLLDALVHGANVSTDDVEFLFDCYFVHACNALPLPCPLALDNHHVLFSKVGLQRSRLIAGGAGLGGV